MAPTSSVPLQIAGYNVLSLSLPPLHSFPDGATHHLYVGLHQPKTPTVTAERSLFLVNVPFDATIFHLKHLLSQQIGLPAGRIEDVQFEGQRQRRGRNGIERDREQGPGERTKKRKRGNKNIAAGYVEGAELPSNWDRDLLKDGLTAIILFVDKTSAFAALKAVKIARREKKHLVWGEGAESKVPDLGSARYYQHYQLSYPSKSVLLESVNNYMTAFAAKEAAIFNTQKKQRQHADVDGFVTVTRGGRTNPPTQEAARAHVEKQKVKQENLQDFYRFQSREKKKERAGELVRKFEEDREKVRKMKERRGRFKPE